MRKITTKNWIRINKTTARRLYKTQPQRLHLCPVNLNPENPWGLLYWPANNETDFETLINLYISYNCTSSETGYYPAFYVSRQYWELVQAATAEFAPNGPAHAALDEWEAKNL